MRHPQLSLITNIRVSVFRSKPEMPKLKGIIFIFSEVWEGCECGLGSLYMSRLMIY